MSFIQEHMKTHTVNVHAYVQFTATYLRDNVGQAQLDCHLVVSYKLYLYSSLFCRYNCSWEALLPTKPEALPHTQPFQLCFT